MQQEFNATRDVYLDRDLRGVVRQLRHVDNPFTSLARTPQLAAGDYLEQYGDLLELNATEIATLGLAPTMEPEDAGVELRYLMEKQQFDTATVAYSQTALGLPVFEAGVAVQMKTEPFRVVSSQSTKHPDLKVARPSAETTKRALAISPAQLSRALGLKKGENGPSVEIERRRLVVYQYEARRVQRDASPPAEERVADVEAGTLAAKLTPAHDVRHQSGMPWLPLPAVAQPIREGEHYVCVKVDFVLQLATWGAIHWTAILDVETLSVLYLRAHVDDVTGLVFDTDPITLSGGTGPASTSAALNPFRVATPLLGLNAPTGGTQALSGDTIALIDSEGPTIAFPTEPGSTNFDFDSRTNNFSAVNAYVHCDRFFRLVDSMGFARSTFFGGTTFPTSVDHRGNINVATGIEINAHCLGTTGGSGILRTTFALADLGDTTNPIGIADDYRVVLHELGGHGVLYNHVSSANFGFAHSAGDSIAAILNDPGSKAPDRFITFPWVNIGRRHDRTPAGGWGWSGNIALHPFDSTLDRFGYNNEQVLSSTLFLIYRSLGGDSTDLNTQRFAARMAVYLILRATATLTPATNPSSGAGFETALETADAGDWTSENVTGGAYRKVVRWAFEKQGMFQPSGTATPNNNIGSPPAVDVYIDDGRGGEYGYQPVFWENQSLWNRIASDGGTTHQDPIVNQTNYAYVKVKNRGSQTATNVIVKAYHANPAAGLSYPNDWVPMTTAQLSGSNIAPNNGGEIIVGPFAWTPTHVGHECMFMIASATGDASNVNNIAAGDSIPEWRLVPNDNNIGQRNVAPVPGGGTSGLAAEFSGLSFEAKNPLLTTATMQVEATLPPMLLQRGWKLGFTNRGGSAFKLEPGASREVVMQIERGAEFTANDVARAEQRTIQVAVRANGVLVGGMSYELDPKIDRPNRPGTHGGGSEPHHNGHGGVVIDNLAESLLQRLLARKQRVRDVEVRKVVLEIDLEECDD